MQFPEVRQRILQFLDYKYFLWSHWSICTRICQRWKLYFEKSPPQRLCWDCQPIHTILSEKINCLLLRKLKLQHVGTRVFGPQDSPQAFDCPWRSLNMCVNLICFKLDTMIVESYMMQQIFFPRLEHLELVNNCFSLENRNAMQLRFRPLFEKFKNLRKICLYEIEFNLSTILTNHPNLQKLRVRDYITKQYIPTFASLEHLRYLRFSPNDPLCFDMFHNIPNLEYLCGKFSRGQVPNCEIPALKILIMFDVACEETEATEEKRIYFPWMPCLEHLSLCEKNPLFPGIIFPLTPYKGKPLSSQLFSEDKLFVPARRIEEEVQRAKMFEILQGIFHCRCLLTVGFYSLKHDQPLTQSISLRCCLYWPSLLAQILLPLRRKRRVENLSLEEE